jgi:hypothetical protein
MPINLGTTGASKIYLGTTEIQKVYLGTTQVYSSAVVGVNGSVIGFTGEDGGGSSASITLNTDGSVTQAAGAETSVADVVGWLIPTSSGAGSGYWVRATSITPSGSRRTGTLNTWQQLSTPRTWSVVAPNNGSVTGWELTFEFSTTSDGSNIVSIESVVFLAASVSEPYDPNNEPL